VVLALCSLSGNRSFKYLEMLGSFPLFVMLSSYSYHFPENSFLGSTFIVVLDFIFPVSG
jgi:hypothetical protein